MPLLILSGLVQLALIVHVMKTGRNTYWIYLIFMVPVIGPAAYIVVELGPELMNSPKARRKIKRVINPKHELHMAEKQARIANTFGTRTHLANEQLQNKQYDLAENNYRDALQGLYEFEPYTMASLARAQFNQNKFSECKATLNTLKQKNPDFRNQDAHLLYARALDNLDDIQGATEEYRALIQYFTGPEPHLHFAQMLAKQGEKEKAITLLENIQDTANASPRHYTKLHKEWIRKAKTLRHEWAH